ncbi:hypothetical protein M2134_002279, partial [Parabacteroides sp. PM6-13]|uniref:hypothetical protein n=1 Tax=Parabacteroides sp. PM6-13 TaxID=1742408 RepID=UPI002474910B
GNAGTNSSIHYSGNFGIVRHTGSKGSAGGLVGRLGDDKEFSAVEITGMVVSSVSMALAPINGILNPYVKAQGDEVSNKLKITSKVFKSTKWVNKGIGWSLKVHNIAHKFIPKDSYNPTLDAEILAAEYQEKINTFQLQQADVFRKAMQIHSSQNNAYAQLYETVGTNNLQFCSRLNADNEYFMRVNEKLHDFKEEKRLKELKSQMTDKIIYTVVKGVLSVASITLSVLLAVGTLGASAVTTAASIALTIGSGTNTLVQKARDFEENVSVIEQCFNQGHLEITNKDVYAGGLVGRFNDKSEISNSYNMGELTTNDNHRKGGIVGYMGDKINIESTVNYALWENPKYGTTLGAADPVYSKNHCKVYYLANENDEDKDEEGRFTAEELKKADTFIGFLDAAYWTLDKEQASFPTHQPKSMYE